MGKISNPLNRRVIAIEGLDAVGKETVSKRVVEILNEMGYKALQISFPRYDEPEGTVIKQFLSGSYGPPASLDPYLASAPYTLDRIRFFKENPLYFDGCEYDFYVLDRGYFSNFIYQASKLRSYDEVYAWARKAYDDELVLSGLKVNFYENYYLMISEDIRQRQMEARLAGGAIQDENESNLKYLASCRKFMEESRILSFWKALSHVDAKYVIRGNGTSIQNIREYYYERVVPVTMTYAERPEDLPAVTDRNAKKIVELATYHMEVPPNSDYPRCERDLEVIGDGKNFGEKCQESWSGFFPDQGNRR